MAHKIIQGGEQYLPFAESLLRELRATGLEYCSRREEMGDASILVTRKAGVEHIHIAGGGCPLRMDSGVVDMIKASEIETPLNYLPGKLYETDANRTYNAGFEPIADSNFRRNPAKTSHGQLSGDVTSRQGGKFTGRLTQDGVTARSFAPRSNPTETGGVAFDDKDEGLYQKKRMVAQCPASMFTGRCRLYVQAMYGAHRFTAATDGAGNPTSAGDEISPSVSLASALAQPYLSLKAYVEADKVIDTPVELSTNTGVHLDPETGKHWLINPGVTGVVVYPLVGSTCAEAARKYLVPGAIDGFTDDDREHLEAYILATCRPKVRQAQILSHGASIQRYSMGYGWHWNWTGLTADIVINTNRPMPFENGFEREGMVSTHYRLQMSKSVDPYGVTQWAAGASTVEGPVEWSVNRGIWAIAEPNWPLRTQEKTTPRYSSYTACNAPFYVFYIRDEIKVCRVQVVLMPAVPGVRVGSPNRFVDTPYGTTMASITVGLQDGYGEDTDAVQAYYRATFSVGDVVFDDLRAGYSESGSRIEIKNKFELPVGYVAHYNSLWDVAFCRMGYPLTEAGDTWNGVTRADSAQNTQNGPRVQFDREFSTTSARSIGIATLIVPFMDAEAIFFQANASIERFRIDRQITRYEDGGFAASERMDTKTPTGYFEGTTYVYYRYSTGFAGGTTLVIPTRDGAPITYYTDVREMSKLICHAGAVDAVMDNLFYYHDVDETCSPAYTARSGVRVTDATVISADRITPVGTTHDGSETALVGWI